MQPPDESIAHVRGRLDVLYSRVGIARTDPMRARLRLAICLKCPDRKCSFCPRLGNDPTGCLMAQFIAEPKAHCEDWGEDHRV